MRLLHAADIHLGLSRYGRPTPSGGHSRVEDFAETLARLVQFAIAQNVAVAIFAGDTFDTRREGPQERDAFARACRQLVDAGITVVILPGNHDGMSTIGDPTTHALLWLQSLAIPNVHVLTKPGQHRIWTAPGPLSVTAIPYPHKRAFEQLLPGRPDEERMLEAGHVMDRMIETLTPEPGIDMPSILVGHFSTVAGKLGSEQTMKMTWDVTISPHVFGAFDYVALGHLHRQQQVTERAWYAGSVEYIDFGEEGPKGYLLVDVERGALPVVTPHESGCRRLATVELHGDVDLIDGLPPGSVHEGDVIRILYDSPSRAKPDTISRLRASALAMGASYVKPVWQPSQPAASRARVVLSADTDRAELLRTYLEVNGLPIEPTLTAGRELIAARTVAA